MDLFPYQVEGAKFLATAGRALLADEMGLGKSAQAIAACVALDARRICVICPASLQQNWFREFQRFGNGIVPQVYSYSKAPAWIEGEEPLDVLILDEAHYLKSKTAKRTQAILGPKCDGIGGLVERAKNVFMLTGTPTPNHPAELWSLLRAVTPGAIMRPNGKPYPYWSFVEKYCVTQDTGFGIKILRGKNTADLKARIAPYVLRRKKEDVLKDLPPIRFDELALTGELKMPQEVIDESWAVQKLLDEKGIQGLKDIAPHVAQLRRYTGLAKVGPAVEWIKDQLEGGLQKLVVFAHHRDVLEGIFNGVSAFTNAPAMITGGTPASQRQAMVDAFQQHPEPRIFLGQIQAAGTGITLTAASDLLFVESSWVPAENEQAAMRIHRIGQRNACLVRFAMLAGSIDERIQRAVMRKATDIAKLFG